MGDIPIIPPIKINLKIKNRCKDGFNHRYQYTNPFGDKFELPPSCKFHKDRVKYQCEQLKIEDVLNFRSEIYKSNEKSHQNEFISHYLEVLLPKRRYGRSEVARVMTVLYNVPNTSGEKFSVCRSMFFAVTGMFEKRIKGITEKLFKKHLMDLGGNFDGMFDTGKKRDPREKREKMKKLLSDKTERILSLEKGSFEVFSKVCMNNAPKDSNLESKTKRRKLKKKAKSVDFEDAESCIEDFDIPMIEDDFQAPKNLINSFEICRICLKSDGENLKTMEPRIIKMIEYCLPIHIAECDNLPQKLCESCFSQLKVSYKLKLICMETQEIIENCLRQQAENSAKPVKDEIFYDSDAEIPFNEPENFMQTEKDNVIDNNEPSNNSTTTSQVTKCYLCDIDFTESSETAVNHFRKSHNKIEMKKCEKCEFESEYPWFMNLHYQIHADDKRLCVFCGKVYKKGSSHLQACKEKRLKRNRLFCRYCQAGYWNSMNLKEHERTHTQERPYQCDQCSSSFYRRIHLRKHMLDHGIEPPFRCNFCSKGFLVKNRLVSHESTCSRIHKQPTFTL